VRCGAGALSAALRCVHHAVPRRWLHAVHLPAQAARISRKRPARGRLAAPRTRAVRRRGCTAAERARVVRSARGSALSRNERSGRTRGAAENRTRARLAAPRPPGGRRDRARGGKCRRSALRPFEGGQVERPYPWSRVSRRESVIRLLTEGIIFPIRTIHGRRDVPAYSAESARLERE